MQCRIFRIGYISQLFRHDTVKNRIDRFQYVIPASKVLVKLDLLVRALLRRVCAVFFQK